MQAPNFREFRQNFRAKPGRNFCVPANTFDNVKGDFPIGFFIWHTDYPEDIERVTTDLYDAQGNFLYTKTLEAETNIPTINVWIITTRNRPGETAIGYMSAKGNDFQNANYNFIINSRKQLPHPRGTVVTDMNLREIAIYISVRHSINATWINDRDQFLYPNDGWQNDKEFQSDCLVFALFHGQNRISNEYGTNYWIPFTEEEVDAKEKFECHFMSDYIKGKGEKKEMTAEEREEYERDGKNYHQADVFEQPKSESSTTKSSPLVFSPEAQAVMDAGKELWRYYHKQPNANPNASFYDIRLYFQGTKTNKSGKVQMNTESQDATYTELITDLRQKLKDLAKKIEPKVYEHGFLKA